MRYLYTSTEIRIYPYENMNRPLIIVFKPYIDEKGLRRESRVTWARLHKQFPFEVYTFAQAMFIAAGLADALNLMVDMDIVQRFGVTIEKP